MLSPSTLTEHFQNSARPHLLLRRSQPAELPLCFDRSTNRGAHISFVLINLQKTGGYPLLHVHLSQRYVQSSQSRVPLTPLFPLDTNIGGEGGAQSLMT